METEEIDKQEEEEKNIEESKNKKDVEPVLLKKHRKKKKKRHQEKADFVLDCCCIRNPKKNDYDGLLDRNLEGFFDKPEKRKILQKNKLINRHGEILIKPPPKSPATYRAAIQIPERAPKKHSPKKNKQQYDRVLSEPQLLEETDPRKRGVSSKQEFRKKKKLKGGDGEKLEKGKNKHGSTGMSFKEKDNKIVEPMSGDDLRDYINQLKFKQQSDIFSSQKKKGKKKKKEKDGKVSRTKMVANVYSKSAKVNLSTGGYEIANANAKEREREKEKDKEKDEGKKKKEKGKSKADERRSTDKKMRESIGSGGKPPVYGVSKADDDEVIIVTKEEKHTEKTEKEEKEEKKEEKEERKHEDETEFNDGESKNQIESQREKELENEKGRDKEGSVQYTEEQKENREDRQQIKDKLNQIKDVINTNKS